MNQAQRKLLIEQIKDRTKLMIEELRKKIPKKPDPVNYYYRALLENKLTIKSSEQLLNILKDRSLKSTSGRSLFNTNAFGSEKQYHSNSMIYLKCRKHILML